MSYQCVHKVGKQYEYLLVVFRSSDRPGAYIQHLNNVSHKNKKNNEF